MNRLSITIFALFLFACSSVHAQQVRTKVPMEPVLDPGDVGKIRAEFRLAFGGGFKSQPVFELTNGTISRISAGGGAGIGFNFGYRVLRQFELSSEFLFQYSTLDLPISNGSAGFSRFVITPTAKYLLPLKKGRHSITLDLGAGYGVYMKGKMDIDAGNISGGAHNIFEYKDGYGPHGIVEVEFRTKKSLSFLGGFKLYNVNYKISKAQSNGSQVPLRAVPLDVQSLNGNGFDMYAGLSFLF